MFASCPRSTSNQFLWLHSFYRVGGGNRIAAFLLAVATAILLVIGTGPIAYIRELAYAHSSNLILYA